MKKIPLGHLVFAVSVLALGAAAAPTDAAADSVSDAIAVCAGCHGEAGVPVDTMTPVIWGQKRSYLLNQLRDFKSGRRKNEIMAGIVESLSWSDMQALAAHYAQQPWPAIKHDAPAGDALTSAHATLDGLNCYQCHQTNYEGDTTRPRLAGQQADYLEKTMKDFRANDRANYPGMTALMRDLSDEEIKSVAAYLASHEANVAQK